MTIRIKNNKIGYYISESLILLFFILTAYVRLVDNNRIALTVCTLSLLISGFYNIAISIYRGNHKLLWFILAATFFWGIGYLMRTEWHYNVNYYINSVAYMGIGYSFIYEKKNRKIYSLLYYLIGLFVLYQLLITKIPIRGFLKDGTSYNYISIVVMFYLCIACIVKEKNGKEIPYIDAIIFLIISIVSYGRGGIATAIAFLILLLIAKAINHNRSLKVYLIGAVGIIIALIAGRQIYQHILSSGIFLKFQQMGLEGERIGIWTAFFQNARTSIWRIIIGGNPGIFSLEGNLHNSFLQMYATFGLIFSLALLYWYMRFYVGALKQKNLWLIVVATAFTLRAFTDKLLFRGYFEIVFYFFVFLGLELSEVRGKKGNNERA